MKCEWCAKETDELYDIYLDGQHDFYVLEVCEECSDLLYGDYYPPELVDEMISNL